MGHISQPKSYSKLEKPKAQKTWVSKAQHEKATKKASVSIIHVFQEPCRDVRNIKESIGSMLR